MKKSWLFVAFVLIMVMAFPSIALGEETTETSEDKTLSPYFFVQGGDGSLEQFPLKDTQVNVTINGVIADIYVTQTYANNGTKPINATYVFPASTRASVHGMKMTIGDQVVIAKIKEREQARQDYEQAKAEGKSASLLEQERPNVFTMSIANVMPDDIVNIELHYTELITPTEGVYQFVFPTVVGPRYSSESASTAPQSDQWIESPYLHEGETPPGTYNITVKLSTGIPIQGLKCDSHKVNVEWTNESQAAVTLADPEEYAGNKDYILDYKLVGSAIQSGLTLYRGEDENFFMLMVQPPERVSPDEIPPRDYTFVLDVSGSMNGYPLDTAKDVIKSLIGSLRPTDKFNLVLFSDFTYEMSDSSVPATKSNIDMAIKTIDQQEGGGGTELAAGLRQALALKHDENYSRSVIIITDGYIGGEKEIYDIISNNLNNTNFFSFGIGTSVNRYLIEGMAKIGLGEPFVVTGPEQAPEAVKLFNEYVKSPLLTDIKVSFNGFDTYDVEPKDAPSLFAKRPILMLGKWKGEPSGSIKITGKTATGDYSYEIPASSAEASESNGAIRYLWARSKVERLSYYNKGYEDPEIVKEITDLGLKYSMMTQYTSFVAVLDVVRNTDGQAADVNQPLPLPENVSDLAVSSAPTAMNPQSGDGGMAFELLALFLSAATMTVLFITGKRRKKYIRQ